MFRQEKESRIGDTFIFFITRNLCLVEKSPVPFPAIGFRSKNEDRMGKNETFLPEFCTIFTGCARGIAVDLQEPDFFTS
ncbi:hypothetical protein SAMN05421747_101254 [Parapedobacter composti]|uniref:Uncharacterized protein n=1 Tax=Parapedobacter composti TaxID=623281 RepID=A0A1I1E197_9SPHI|nr:hypothetical protein SAMN05421747_101254 [Parapedobacter composti]